MERANRTFADELLAKLQPTPPPTITPPPKGTPSKRRPGRRTDRAHPLADCDGRVHAHRLLAWELWAPGPAQCWQCGESVWFIRQVPKAALVPFELRVAFADRDESNVTANNLRPSCPPCLRRWLRG